MNDSKRKQMKLEDHLNEILYYTEAVAVVQIEGEECSIMVDIPGHSLTSIDVHGVTKVGTLARIGRDFISSMWPMTSPDPVVTWKDRKYPVPETLSYDDLMEDVI